MGLGWSHANYGRTLNNAGAWSEGYHSSLLFSIKKNNKINSIKLNFEKILILNDTPLQIDIFLNDIFLETFNLGKKDLNLILKTDKLKFVDSVNVIDFKIRNPVTPISLLESIDGRLLGFLINAIEFQ